LAHPAECRDYFKGKVADWNVRPPQNDWRKYVKTSGKANLAQEFRTDSLFRSVICPYLKQYAIGQEKNVTASIIQEAISFAEGDPLSLEVNLIIAAVLEACDYPDTASQLLLIVVGALIVGGILAYMFSD
jgi:hypothetical protein